MKNQTIFITGGNAGIGLATALLFAREGANVAIVGRRGEQNEAAARQVEALGVRCVTFAGDVTDEIFLREAVTQTEHQLGGLHYAFNNAGVEQIGSPLTNQTVPEFRHVMDINVLGVWLSMREQIPALLRSGGGCIVNTSSVAGLIGMANYPIYIASKHAVIGLTKAIALEYAKQGIRVNTVCPGAVKTDLYERFIGHNAEVHKAVEAMHPMGRTGTVEEVANAVLYLCRDATWTTGQSLVMDGGLTVP